MEYSLTYYLRLERCGRLGDWALPQWSDGLRFHENDELEGNIWNRVRIRRRAVSNVERIAGGEIASLPEVRRPSRRD